MKKRKRKLAVGWWRGPSVAVGAIVWSPIVLIFLGYESVAAPIIIGLVSFAAGISVGTYLTCRFLDLGQSRGIIELFRKHD